MTTKATSIAIKLACIAVLAASLSGCIVYVGHDHDIDTKAPATAPDEKPAQTGSF